MSSTNEAVFHRRNKQIQDAIDGQNLKQALQLIEKRMKKGENTRFLRVRMCFPLHVNGVVAFLSSAECLPAASKNTTHISIIHFYLFLLIFCALQRHGGHMFSSVIPTRHIAREASRRLSNYATWNHQRRTWIRWTSSTRH